MEAQVREIGNKLAHERRMMDASKNMFRMLTDKNSRDQCEANIIESQKRLDFLEKMRKDLLASLAQLHNPTGPGAISSSGTTGSTDRLPGAIKYRLLEIRHKLDTELKVKAGTENLLNALGRNPAGMDPRLANELREKMQESQAKIQALTRADHRYAALYIEPVAGQEEDEPLMEIKRVSTGRFRVKLIGAANLPGRTSQQADVYATITIDGQVKAATRPRPQRWDEQFDIQVDNAYDVEIAVYSKSAGLLLAMSWFKLADLEEDLKVKYQGGFSGRLDDAEEMWLDMEPAGQILLKLAFAGVQKARTQRDQVFRRGAVQKAYPRNGHKFFALVNYHIIQSQCAVCNEFLGGAGSGYQCASCNYTCHAKCYQNVHTKCITLNEIRTARPGTDLNTGQLLKYKIPHRFESKTNLVPTWCAHCGAMSGPGQRVNKCSECGKCAHRECTPMVPFFCGLRPEMALQLQAERLLQEEQRRLEEQMKQEAETQRLEAARQEAVARERERARQQELARLAEQARLDKLREQQFLEEQRRILMQIEEERMAKRAAEEKRKREEEERKRQVELLAEQKRAEELRKQKEYEEQVRQQKEKFEKEKMAAVEAQQRKATIAAGLSSSATVSSPPVPPRNSGRINIPASVSKNVSLEDFEFVSVLGRGAFGKVMLAQEKQTTKYYAIKALKKEFILQNDDVKSVKLEKRIYQAASAAQHPFMVNLHSAFQTEARVYFVMEYVSGGDLMCHIQEKKRFSQVRTKFYACEVLLALDYFHKNNIIYRDLKLDNILMCPDGHIKVADYGICKENMAYGALTRTYCGTPDYMAPEILSQLKYGRACDWWSFGVLIYVMLIGRYPFHGEEESDILDAIMADAIEYPTNMPKDTLSLLQGLLKKDPTRRLGGGRLDAEEVRRHPYFAGVDWEAFMRKAVPPPWKPVIKSATDVSNFDAEFTKEKPILTPITSVLSSVRQAEFSDFDYVADWVIDARARAAAARG
ncbi:kinase-like domain-containing protein [Zopfochytrium polystomum]|nr:kinase-like domain-containing protein [Zopfochytrium polystomum]